LTKVPSDILSDKPVLVVEPQVPIALLVRSILMELGATQVQLCTSAEDSLARLSEGLAPALAIVDIDERNDTTALIAQLASAGVGVVVTSAGALPEPVAPALVRIMVSKPYLESEMKAAVLAALRECQ
jgi:CheY-like chemotaxis protein